MADKPNRFDACSTEVTRGFDRNAKSWERVDRNAIPERPMRNRPLMPNVAELAGEHRGERPRSDE